MMQVGVDCPDEQGKGAGEASEKSQNRERNGPGEMTGSRPRICPRIHSLQLGAVRHQKRNAEVCRPIRESVKFAGSVLFRPKSDPIRKIPPLSAIFLIS